MKDAVTDSCSCYWKHLAWVHIHPTLGSPYSWTTMFTMFIPAEPTTKSSYHGCSNNAVAMDTIARGRHCIYSLAIQSLGWMPLRAPQLKMTNQTPQTKQMSYIIQLCQKQFQDMPTPCCANVKGPGVLVWVHYPLTRTRFHSLVGLSSLSVSMAVSLSGTLNLPEQETLTEYCTAVHRVSHCGTDWWPVLWAAKATLIRSISSLAGRHLLECKQNCV